MGLSQKASRKRAAAKLAASRAGDCVEALGSHQNGVRALGQKVRIQGARFRGRRAEARRINVEDSGKSPHTWGSLLFGYRLGPLAYQKAAGCASGKGPSALTYLGMSIGTLALLGGRGSDASRSV